MTVANPYQAPPEPAPAEAETEQPEDRVRMIGEMIIRWEKLRLAYNAVLSLIVIGFVVFSFARAPLHIGLLAPLFFLAFLANVCFSVGPIVVSYVCWAGASPRVARGTTFILFTLGTVFASLLAIMALLSL